MKLSEYPHPPGDTGLGIHASAGVNYPLGEEESAFSWWLDEMQSMGIKWIKLLTSGGPNPSALGPARAVLARGMIPIIRPYRREPAPWSLFDKAPEFRQALQVLIDAGCRYIETDKNEPNLLDEWDGGWGSSDADPTEWKKGAQPDRVAEAWVRDAAIIAEMGGLPGTPPLSPGGHYNDVDFFRTFLAWLKEHKYDDLLAQGCWIAIHNSTLNHPLDYPYDPVNQLGIPVSQDEYNRYQWAGDINFVNGERARGKNPGQTLLSVDANGKDTGGSNCWLKFQAYHDLFVQTFGFELPILSTEGGVWVGTRVGDEPYNQPRIYDPRYPAVDMRTHMEWTREICRAMMAGEYPQYYFCTGFWLIANRGMGNRHMPFERDAWYSYYWPAGQLPVVQALKDMPKQARPAGVPAAPDQECPYYHSDRHGMTPQFIILHDTEGSAEAALSWWRDPQNPYQSSAHDLVRADGVVVHCVPYELAAHHAGGGRWPGVTDGSIDGTSIINLVSIGVEMEYPAAPDAPAWPQAQLDAARGLVRGLAQHFHIPAERVLRHSDVDTRHADPRNLDWKGFLDGVFADEQAADVAYAIRAAAWNALSVPYVPANALQRAAAESNLGGPLTVETDTTVNGVGFRWQAYAGGIVYARLGDWAGVKIVRW
jgi:N-acetyl-anhydromuramyl-L-alanine amidase AmpD